MHSGDDDDDDGVDDLISYHVNAAHIISIKSSATDEMK